METVSSTVSSIALSFVRMLFSSSTTCPTPNNNSNNNNDSNNKNDTPNTTKQQGRPMPDMDAFDRHDDDDIDGSGSATIHGTVMTTTAATTRAARPRTTLSNKLLTCCPPTPMPTPPSWVQFRLFSDTKVLATCSPKTLDRRTLLENSILQGDDDDDDDDDDDGCLSSPMSIDDTFSTDSPHCLDLKSNNRCNQHGGKSSYHHGQEQPGPPQLSVVVKTTIDPVVSMLTSFDILSDLGKGRFAQVYKVRSKTNGKLYAVKKNLEMFANEKDRERQMAEFRYMQHLQTVDYTYNNKSNRNNNNSLYLVSFYQAWQQEGHLHCQMELCCRHSCRELMDSLRRNWCQARAKYPCLRRLIAAADNDSNPENDDDDDDADTIGRHMPESTIWKICHDVCAGLSHMHSHGIVHHDVKPSNVFFVSQSRFGAMCKIGDFGLAGEMGTPLADGQEGDSKYLAPELLSSAALKQQPSADIFSLGLLLYEMSSNLAFEIPSDGPRWRELRCGGPKLFDHHHIPPCRDAGLIALFRSMIQPIQDQRPTADQILHQHPMVKQAGMACQEFLRDYILDVESFARGQIQQLQPSPRISAPYTPVSTTKCGVFTRPMRLAFSPLQMICSPETATRF